MAVVAVASITGVVAVGSGIDSVGMASVGSGVAAGWQAVIRSVSMSKTLNKRGILFIFSPFLALISEFARRRGPRNGGQSFAYLHFSFHSHNQPGSIHMVQARRDRPFKAKLAYQVNFELGCF
jgi:hypothetical protein